MSNQEPSSNDPVLSEPVLPNSEHDELSHEEQLTKLATYLDDLKRYRMPFGRFGPDNFPPAGKLIFELPHDYLIWYQDKGGGFPRGRLGELMQFVCEVKGAGAEEIFAVLRQA